MDASADRPSALVDYASRISRHTSIYVAGTASVLVFGLVQVAVYTHYLEPAEYGLLAVYVVIASLLTIAYNLCSLQGTLMSVFGAAEGGEDAGDVTAGESARAPEGAQRRTLTTGLLITLAVAVLGTLALWLVGPLIGPSLVGTGYTQMALMLAAASGALGAVWRLVTNVPRLERRPVTFAVLNNLRPAFVVGCTIPLVASGHGVNGALVGMTIGSAASILVAFIVSHSAYEASVGLQEARRIMRMGSAFVPVVLGLWVVHNADVYLLSRYAPDSDVGTYRLAARLGAFGSYFVSGFLMSWTPLERTALARGTYSSQGRASVRSTLVTYYVLTGLGLVLGLSLGADALVKIAPPAYADAAELIPFVALGLVVYGLFNVLVRTGIGVNNRVIYPIMSVLCAIAFVAAALVLIPWLNGYGAALAIVVGMAPGIVVYWILVRRTDEPLRFDYRALLIGAATATGCFFAARLVRGSREDVRAAIDIAAFAAYPLLLVVFGAVPRGHVRPLIRVLSAALPALRRPDVRAGLGELDIVTATLVRAVVLEQRDPSSVAQERAMSADEVYDRVEAGLRTIAGLGTRDSYDRRVVDYLTANVTVGERDLIAERLIGDGVDPLEIDALEAVFASLRRLPARAWPATVDALRSVPS